MVIVTCILNTSVNLGRWVHILCHTDTYMFMVICEKLGQGPALDESRN